MTILGYNQTLHVDTETNLLAITNVQDGTLAYAVNTGRHYKYSGGVWNMIAVRDTDGTLSANSDTRYATQKAVKTYVDTGDATKLPTSYLDTDGTFTANSDTKIASQKATKTYVDARQRKAWVSGVLKNGSFVYASKASTAGGAGNVTFYITDNGLSSGSAVFTNVYADSVAVIAYGASGNYQTSNPVVAADKKSITCTISQITTVLGLLTFNSVAGNGIDCRLYVIGD